MLLLNATFVDAALRKSPRLEFLANKISLCVKAVIIVHKWKKNTSNKINSSMKAETKVCLSTVNTKRIIPNQYSSISIKIANKSRLTHIFHSKRKSLFLSKSYFNNLFQKERLNKFSITRVHKKM